MYTLHVCMFIKFHPFLCPLFSILCMYMYVLVHCVCILIHFFFFSAFFYSSCLYPYLPYLSIYPLLFFSLSLYLFSHPLSPSLLSLFLSPKGTTVWYNNPPPGRLLPNNTAISVHENVNEIRCYSGDTSTNNDATLILTPTGSSQPLSFTNMEAGYLRKNGQTAIGDVTNGVYTCQYTNSTGGVSYTSFAVFPRTREPSSGSSNTSKCPTCTAHALAHVMHMLCIISCTSSYCL